MQEIVKMDNIKYYVKKDRLTCLIVHIQAFYFKSFRVQLCLSVFLLKHGVRNINNDIYLPECQSCQLLS